MMYTGTLISDLLELVERAEASSGSQGRLSGQPAPEQLNYSVTKDEAERRQNSVNLRPISNSCEHPRRKFV